MPIASSTRIRYTISAATLACKTNLSFKSKKVISWQDINLENNVRNGSETNEALKINVVT